VCPQLEQTLFTPSRPGYVALAVDKATIKSTIHGHPEFARFISRMNSHFSKWRNAQLDVLRAMRIGCKPKQLIAELSESLLGHYLGRPLIDAYAVYQHLMDYWEQTMQDDCYLIAAEGWTAQTYRVVEVDKKGREKDKGWACDLVPKALVVSRYFKKEQKKLDALRGQLEVTSANLAELEDEHTSEDGAFSSFERINAAAVKERLREIEAELTVEIRAAKLGKRGLAMPDETDDIVSDELRVLLNWMKLAAEESALKKRVREADNALNAMAYAKYPELSEAEIQTLVIEDKWLSTLETAVHSEMDRLIRQLTSRVQELAERYEVPMARLNERAFELEARVASHLKSMGFA
jgi:type I restriction enzyme M protein